MKALNTKTTMRMFGVFAVIGMYFQANSLADEKTFEEALKSTVWINVRLASGTRSGSGVLVDAEKRLVVTNEHVVNGQKEIIVFFPNHRSGRLVSEKENYIAQNIRNAINAKVVIADKKRDLAILRLERIPNSACAMAVGEPARPGQEIHTIGNSGASNALWVYSYGRVRARYYKKIQSEVARQFLALETQLPSNPGDSGGPVFDNKAKLVAINQSHSPVARLVTTSVDSSEIVWLLEKARNGSSLPHKESNDSQPSLRNLGFFSGNQ